MGGKLLNLLALGLVAMVPLTYGQEAAADDWLVNMVDDELYLSSEQDFQPAHGGGSWKKFPKGMRWANRAWGEGNFRKDDISKAKAVDVDGMFTPVAEIKRLKSMGKFVMCYISGGTLENYRPDAKDFRAVSGLVGNTMQGWYDERWLNIHPSKATALRRLMGKRMQQLKQKGCDAVEVDNIDCYQNSACLKGFKFTRANAYKYQLDYNKWLANYAHSQGMAIGQKNNYEQIASLKSYFDFFVYEECAEWKICNLIKPYIQMNKAVFGTEYTGNRNRICTEANKLGYSTKYAGGPDGWYDCEDFRTAGAAPDIAAAGDGWGLWTEWSACTVTCGTGTQSRNRECLADQCVGVTKETIRCDMGSCATVEQDPHPHCVWNDWVCDPCDCENLSTHCTRTAASAPGTCGPFTGMTSKCQCGPSGAPAGSDFSSVDDSASIGESSDSNQDESEFFVFGDGMVEGEDNVNAQGSAGAESEPQGAQGAEGDMLFDDQENQSADEGDFVFGDPMTAEDADSGDVQDEPDFAPEVEEDVEAMCEWSAWTKWSKCQCSAGEGRAVRYRTPVDASVCDDVTREEEARRCSCGKSQSEATTTTTNGEGAGQVAGAVNVEGTTDGNSSSGPSTSTIVGASVGAAGAVVALAGVLTGVGVAIRRRKARKAAEERVPFWAQYSDENEGLPDVSVEHM